MPSVSVQKPTIHPTATVSVRANLASGVEVGPYAVLGDEVEVNENTYIGPHVIIEGKTTIGKNCKLIASCSIGLMPQDLSYKGEQTGVKIGDGTIIREYVTVHRAVKEGFTVIGNNCYLMNYVHVAHNVQLGNNVIMANSSTLAGYTTVEDYVFISAFSTLHQHCRIGESAMIGAMTGSRLDVPPYFVADGRPARMRNINKVGLRRRGIKKEIIDELIKAFKVLYQSELNTSNALEKIEKELIQHNEIKKLLLFFRTTKRGVLGKQILSNDEE